MRIIRISLVLTVVFMHLLAGCSAPKVEIIATMKEYTFEPNRWEVPAGAEVILTLINDGTLEHEFVIMIFGKTATAPFDEDDEANIYWEAELQPRTSVEITFTAPNDPGEYQVVCGTPEHLEQGMRGTLVVK